MASFSVGAVVLIPFPFSDLSQYKVRPAVCLAVLTSVDVILCQVTSNRYGDGEAVEVQSIDLEYGTLLHLSYARPGKLFTAGSTIIQRQVGQLSTEKTAELLNAVVSQFRTT